MRRIQVGIVVSAMAVAGLVWAQGRNHGGTPPVIPHGAVACHMVGQFVINADGTADMYGYYPFIEGLQGPFFSGAPSEATAYFTFQTTSFTPQIVPNGNIYEIFLMPPAGTVNSVNVYLNTTPAGDFTNPATFSAGQLVATFNSRGGMITAVPNAAGTGMDTIQLVSSTDFVFNGQTFNFSSLGGGATLTFMPTGTPLSGSLTSLPVVVPFGGSGVSTGNFVPTSLTVAGN